MLFRKATIVSRLLATILAAGLFGPLSGHYAVPAHAASIPLLTENFDGTAVGAALPAGWSKLAANGANYSQTVSADTYGNHMLKLYSNLAAQQVGASRTFPAQDKTVAVEVYYQAGAANTGTSQFYLYGTEGLAVKIWAGDGKFYAHNGDTKKTMPGTLVAGEWYRLKVVADVRNDQYDFYVNDTLVADNYSFVGPRADLNKLQLQTLASSAKVHESYWDNVQVHRIQQPPRVESSLPADRAEDVSVWTPSMTLTFDEEMNEATLDPINIVLTKGSFSESVIGAVYSKTSTAYTIGFPARLDYRTTYRVSITDNVYSAEGMPAVPQTLTFTTADNPFNHASAAVIASPRDGDGFTAGDGSIVIQAEASDPEGIRRVEFYNGSTFLGADATAPYEYVWSNPGLGAFVLRALVLDEEGIYTPAPSVSITVNRFTVNRPAIVDATGAEVSALAADSVVQAVTIARNNTSAEKPVTLMMALYDPSNRMVSAAYDQRTVTAYSVQTFNASLTMPADVSGHRVKAFVWDTPEGHTEYTDAVVVRAVN